MLEKDKKISYSILEFIKNLVQGLDNFLIFFEIIIRRVVQIKNTYKNNLKNKISLLFSMRFKKNVRILSVYCKKSIRIFKLLKIRIILICKLNIRFEK